jgi:hypothetical protein
MGDVEAMGVRRVSVGGALARCAWTGFIRAATLAKDGRFDGFAGGGGGAERHVWLTQRCDDTAQAIHVRK